MQTHSDQSATTSGAPGTPGPASLMRRLLLVDDEADGAEFAALLLRSHGLEVRVAHSAPEALQALEEDSDVDAVLSDIMMPSMTGLELAEAIAAKYPAIKIVLMSGYVAPELLRDRGHDYAFVEKPYRIDTIIELLRA